MIFDLDGVLADSSQLHLAAWREVFDGFLERSEGPGFRPFDAAEYREYVDGKPRLEGVRAFLRARGITLNQGSECDVPSHDTVCGLGNAKNALFQRLLSERGVAVEPATRSLIAKLREKGLLTAVVSASRNARAVLDGAVLHGFDAIIDGDVAQRCALAGKPRPDTFLEAAHQLGVAPSRAVVVEDATAGVAAARAGRFGLVIGVGGDERRTALLNSGAHAVVRRAGDLEVEGLSSALETLPAIAASGAKVSLFLDFDGTLSPIVSRPQDAALSEQARAVVQRLAKRTTVAIVSGREMSDIRERVALPELNYAADHGFSIETAHGDRVNHQQADSYVTLIAALADALKARLRSIEGVLLEPKRFSVAVHYRLVEPTRWPDVSEAVREALEQHPQLRCLPGKMVHDLQPAIDWNKGKAVRWLADTLGVSLDEVVYIGDDATDEDAFCAIRGRGTGIVVWERPRPTAASYYLRDPDEVMQFLLGLESMLDGHPA